MDGNGMRKKYTIGCGLWGPVLSGIIIASRAVCSNVPMEQWSAWSWVLMTLPMTLPFVMFVIVALGCLVTYVIAELFLSISKRRGW